jgi:hypothetical protein
MRELHRRQVERAGQPTKLRLATAASDVYVQDAIQLFMMHTAGSSSSVRRRAQPAHPSTPPQGGAPCSPRVYTTVMCTGIPINTLLASLATHPAWGACCRSDSSRAVYAEGLSLKRACLV